MTKEGRHNWGNSGSNWRCTFNTEWDIVQNLKGTVSNVSFENTDDPSAFISHNR